MLSKTIFKNQALCARLASQNQARLFSASPPDFGSAQHSAPEAAFDGDISMSQRHTRKHISMP